MKKRNVSKIASELGKDECGLIENARKLWLCSFYFAGMRASDVLRLTWKDSPTRRRAILDKYLQFKENEDN